MITSPITVPELNEDARTRQWGAKCGMSGTAVAVVGRTELTEDSGGQDNTMFINLS